MNVRFVLAAATAAGLAATAACGTTLMAQTTASSQHLAAVLQGIHKIKHVIVIMQENRSYDTYFGKYPAPGGIPAGVCVPDPRTMKCVKPYANHADSNVGGPHDASASAADVDGGKMDGFIREAQKWLTGKHICKPPMPNKIVPCPTDVMGYHAGTDIPDYWAYAHHFVLLTKMYEAVHSWSLPFHLYLASGWSATCKVPGDPMSCKSDDMPARISPADPTPFAWTSLTFLLNRAHVRWGWYLDHGTKVPPIWNVLPGFTDLHQGTQSGSVQPLRNFYNQVAGNNLPAVSWIFPDGADSEHPRALVSTGQAYVTKIINAVMRHKATWASTAIFLAWDDWGGFYDNVRPKIVDTEGYGIRVPGLIISPYAKAGVPDSTQTLSSDAYLKFIEDDFLNGQRLDPKTDGRPDSRTVVREEVSGLGDLSNDFNFNQMPLPPLILDPCPKNTTLTPHPNATCTGSGGLTNAAASQASDD